jgi:hypothetical protein
MPGQHPEIMLVDGHRLPLYTAPLVLHPKFRVFTDFLADVLHAPRTAGLDRGCLGTWEVRNGMLHLVHLTLSTSAEDCDEPWTASIAAYLAEEMSRTLGTPAWPIPATWFDGHLRIVRGNRLVHRHYGFSSWHEREHVLTCRSGVVVRERTVNTRAIAEWYERRSAQADGVPHYPPPFHPPGGQDLFWLPDQEFP